MGSKVGWILAGVIAAVVLVIVLVVFVIGPSPIEPTSETLATGALERKDISLPLSAVLGREPSGDGNAGDDYALAVKLLKDSGRTIDDTQLRIQRLLDGRAVLGPEELTLLEKLAAHVRRGANNKAMRYALVHTPPKLRVAFRHAFVDDLLALRAAVRMLGYHYMAHQQWAKAKRAFEDLLVFGRHMVEERAVAYAVYAGISAQTSAVRGLHELYQRWPAGNQNAAAGVARYAAALAAFDHTWRQKRGIVSVLQPHSGDLFNIAENDQDRAWRVQALLNLGILRFSRASHEGDQKKIRQLIDENLQSDDPLLKAAVEAARDLTPEQFNALGSTY